MSTGIGAAKSSDICSVGLKTSVWRCRCCLPLKVAAFCVLDIAELSFCCFGSDALFGAASLGGAPLAAAKGAPPNDAAPKSASEPKQQNESSAISSTQKAATLSGKQQRQRQTDVFKPTEQISEDFAAPMPVDI